MSYRFQKTYTLLPQSPLIHFQHEQKGATLRASEVKPKLDRYIIRRYQRENGASVPKSWIMDQSPDDQPALRYKLRITATGEPEFFKLGFYKEELPNGKKITHRDYDIFYGNMNAEHEKKGVKVESELTVTCMIGDLLTYIDSVLFDFFIVTNFGTMQDKGFGSFRVKGFKKSVKDFCDIIKNEYGCERCYYFKTTADKTFRQIKAVYSLMKSGINMSFMPRTPDAYRRSMLFTYMHNYGIGNEKAWMKQNGISPAIGANSYHRNPPEDKERYVRALLGIGELIEYKNSEYNPKDKVTVKIAETKKEIARLSSPIMFKVIGKPDAQFVFFFGREIDEIIYGRTFEFSSSMGSGKLTVPKKDELPENYIDDFMRYVFVELKKCQNKFADIKALEFKEV